MTWCIYKQTHKSESTVAAPWLSRGSHSTLSPWIIVKTIAIWALMNTCMQGDNSTPLCGSIHMYTEVLCLSSLTIWINWGEHCHCATNMVTCTCLDWSGRVACEPHLPPSCCIALKTSHLSQGTPYTVTHQFLRFLFSSSKAACSYYIIAVSWSYSK